MSNNNSAFDYQAEGAEDELIDFFNRQQQYMAAMESSGFVPSNDFMPNTDDGTGGGQLGQTFSSLFDAALRHENTANIIPATNPSVGLAPDSLAFPCAQYGHEFYQDSFNMEPRAMATNPHALPGAQYGDELYQDPFNMGPRAMGAFPSSNYPIPASGYAASGSGVWSDQGSSIPETEEAGPSMFSLYSNLAALGPEGSVEEGTLASGSQDRSLERGGLFIEGASSAQKKSRLGRRKPQDERHRKQRKEKLSDLHTKLNESVEQLREAKKKHHRLSKQLTTLQQSTNPPQSSGNQPSTSASQMSLADFPNQNVASSVFDQSLSSNNAMLPPGASENMPGSSSETASSSTRSQMWPTNDVVSNAATTKSAKKPKWRKGITDLEVETAENVRQSETLKLESKEMADKMKDLIEPYAPFRTAGSKR